jgi:hypothetical protein
MKRGADLQFRQNGLPRDSVHMESPHSRTPVAENISEKRAKNLRFQGSPSQLEGARSTARLKHQKFNSTKQRSIL